MSQTPLILVVGSINMDLVVRCHHRPAPGETVLGDHLKINPGGKGANQAVAVARLGCNCALIGRVGDDQFGRVLLDGLVSEGIDCQGIRQTPSTPSGAAVITVDASGENAIIVASGANFRLTPDDIFEWENLFAEADVLVMQLELPLPTVRAALNLARRHNCKTILDPAPAPTRLPDDLYNVDIISPNVSEAEVLTGMNFLEERIDKIVALDLVARGAKAALLKLGPRGSMAVVSDAHFYRVPAYKVKVIDSTGAGDAFTAAVAVATARGQDLHTAAKFANAAGALACTKIGAQSAMPTAQEVHNLMSRQDV